MMQDFIHALKELLLLIFYPIAILIYGLAELFSEGGTGKGLWEFYNI